MQNRNTFGFAAGAPMAGGVARGQGQFPNRGFQGQFPGAGFQGQAGGMGQMGRMSLFTGEPIGPYVPGTTPPAMPAPKGTDEDPNLPFNERIKRFYAMHLAYEGQSEIFKDTEFWNWGYWTPTTSSQDEACRNLMEILLYFIPNKSGRIIDVACGRGGTTRYILNYYDPKNVTGINISPEQIAACRERIPHVTFEEMDAANLEFEDNSIDNIICVEAACHFNTREKFLKEALRVLKPGGRVSLTDPLLRRETEIQPEENYLETAVEYKQVCLDAGFARSKIFDITDECWNRFTAFQMNKARERMRAGEGPLRTSVFSEMWLRRTAPVAYIVGWAEKAHT